MKARKIVVPVVIVAGVAAVGAGIYALSSASAAVAYTDASLIEKQDVLRNYISVTGTVQSSSFNGVYSTLNYPVESVNAEVGDTVRKGDVLCTLDTDSIQTQILQQQASIDSSNITSQYQLTQAEQNYNDALEEYNNGTNASIASAKFSLEQAKSNLDKAQENYDKAVEMSSKDKNTQLQNAELTLENAKYALENAQKDYDKAKENYDNEDYYSIESYKKAYDDAADVLNDAKFTNTEVKKATNDYQNAYSDYIKYYYTPEIIPVNKSIADYSAALTAAEKNLAEVQEKYNVKNATDSYKDAVKDYEKVKAQIDEKNLSALRNAETALENAKKNVEAAEISLRSVKDNNSDGINNYKSQLSDAQLAYENAKENLSIVTKSVESNLNSLKASAERERTLSTANDSQLITLESLKQQLDEAVIKAPCDGTVTFANATVGSAPAGTLFAIEDPTDLKITANLREYDVSSVKIGMPVIIKSDALGGVEYDGIVTKIAPTAAKNADGSDAGTALFAVEVAVTSKDTDLKIGMTAKLQIITEEADDAFAVMYDSITTDENGNDIVYLAEKSDMGYVAKAVPVTVGIETDYLAQISGSDISEGDIVINDIDLITDGQPVLIDEAELGIADSLTGGTEGVQTE